MFDTQVDHWFLLLVDTVKRQLVYLDSKPNHAQTRFRERLIRRVAVFMEEILEDRSYYKFQQSIVPAISAYRIVVPPDMLEQANRYCLTCVHVNAGGSTILSVTYNGVIRFASNFSVDCGAWVARWMALFAKWGTYRLGVSGLANSL